MTAGSAPTPTEPPAPWTPPAHWPPMPAGISPDATAHWIASHRQTDAIIAQNGHLEAATASAKAATAVQQKVLDMMSAQDDQRVTLLLDVLRIIHRAPSE